MRHGSEMTGDEWWGCEEPERPLDDEMCLDTAECDACLLKAAAVLAIEGDDGVLWEWHGDRAGEPPMSLTELVEGVDRLSVSG